MTLTRVKSMKDSEVQTWLHKVGQEKVNALVIALLGADADVRKGILRNMSPRAGQVLQAELEKAQKQGTPETEIQQRARELERLM